MKKRPPTACPDAAVRGRSESNRALRKDRYYYEQLIEHSSDGVVVLARDGTIRFIAPSVVRLLGVPPRFILGRSVFKFVDESTARTFRMLLAGLEHDAQNTVVYRIAHRDGSSRIHEANYRNLVRGSAVQGVLVNFRDITQRMETEERLRAREKQLSYVERLSTTGEMASALAHELNQPFFAILNFVAGCRRYIQSGNFSSEEILAILDLTQREAERAGRIIKTVRNFTRNAHLQRGKLDLRDVARDIIDMVNLRARQARIVTEFEFDALECELDCDPVLIQQVLLNFAVNGIEAIEHADGTRRLLRIGVHRQGQRHVKLAVADSGQGLVRASPDKLIGAFFSTKPDRPGIGLSLCRTIVETHGGHIWATRNYDGETVFHALFPRAGD